MEFFVSREVINGTPATAWLLLNLGAKRVATKSSSQLNDDTYYPFYTVETPSSQCSRLVFMIQLITGAGEATAQGTSEPDGFESSKVQFFFFHIVVLKYHGKKEIDPGMINGENLQQMLVVTLAMDKF